MKDNSYINLFLQLGRYEPSTPTQKPFQMKRMETKEILKLR